LVGSALISKILDKILEGLINKSFKYLQTFWEQHKFDKKIYLFIVIFCFSIISYASLANILPITKQTDVNLIEQFPEHYTKILEQNFETFDNLSLPEYAEVRIQKLNIRNRFDCIHDSFLRVTEEIIEINDRYKKDKLRNDSTIPENVNKLKVNLYLYNVKKVAKYNPNIDYAIPDNINKRILISKYNSLKFGLETLDTCLQELQNTEFSTKNTAKINKIINRSDCILLKMVIDIEKFEKELSYTQNELENFEQSMTNKEKKISSAWNVIKNS